MTTTTAGGRAAGLREQIGHPIIDSDAHFTEWAPLFREQFIETAGAFAGRKLEKALSGAPDLFRYLLERTTPMGQGFGSSRWTSMSVAARKETGAIVPGWSPPHTNMLDQATSVSPGLLYERMDEIGIDFSILYPSIGLAFPHIAPDELRQLTCRVFNVIIAEAYRSAQDKMTPAALIPMYTPGEAIEELEYAVTELGYKVAMIGHVARPIPSVHRNHPDLFPVAFALDSFGLDSTYDYDPFWAKCAELRVPLVAHNPSYGIGFRRSPTNYLYNQTGNFAEAGDFLCRSLFLGGVTRRFPTLKFQFLEGGVGWACILYSELVARWQKRNISTIQAHIETARAGAGELLDLLKAHGVPRIGELIDQQPPTMPKDQYPCIDDFAAAKIESIADVKELFVPHFFFGCEADDPLTAWAFNTRTNPLGVSLRATLGSDMGHWDVPDITGVLPEAYELVEKELISEEDFERFTFSHPCEFFAGVNPNFFQGTAVGKHIDIR